MSKQNATDNSDSDSVLRRLSLDTQRLVERAKKSIVCVGAGKAEPRTGFIVADGELITVAREAVPGESVPVHTKNGQIDAVVAGFDSASGLALLRHSDLKGDDLGALRSASLGELTVTIACPIPNGYEARLAMVRCAGAETRLPGGRRVDSYFQTDAARFRGFGGSVVYGADGSVLGITMPVRPKEESFVLPIDEVVAIAKQLAEGGGSGTGYLGVRTMPTELPTKVDDFTDGLLVVGVDEDSPASNAGVRVGDFIVKVGGTATPSVEALYDSLVGRKEGESLELVVADGSGSMRRATAAIRLR